MKFRGTARLAAVTALALLVILPAWALPRFAQKERKHCSFCHIKPTGGGKRNSAGHWYETHGLSLAGYKPPKPSGKPAPKKAAAKPLARQKPSAPRKANGRK